MIKSYVTPPLSEEPLAKLRGSQILSTLDLTTRYRQTLLRKQDLQYAGLFQNIAAWSKLLNYESANLVMWG